MKKRKIKIYDTISKKYVNVEVSEEVYIHYKRTEWNIKDNDKSFYEHEIQFSALIGGDNSAFENFKEFISEYNLENEVVHKVSIEKLYDCLIFLSENELRLIKMLYFYQLTERECAKRMKTNRKNIHKTKIRVLYKLNKLLNKK